MSMVVGFGAVVLVLALLALLVCSRLRPKTIAVLLVGVVVVYAGGVFWFEHALAKAMQKLNGPRHIFQASTALSFLPESVAIENARAALRLDNYDERAWHPASYASTIAPDGRPDLYLLRNAVNPKLGTLVFTNTQGSRCFVSIEIQGRNLICQRVYAK